jgi:hypothetical protein
MSLRIVRVLTPNRSANSDPGQAGRDCIRASSDSNLEEVSRIFKMIVQLGI